MVFRGTSVRLRLQTHCAVCKVLMYARIDVVGWPQVVRLECPRRHSGEYEAKTLQLEWRKEDQRREHSR
jgi:hypothetical protein